MGDETIVLYACGNGCAHRTQREANKCRDLASEDWKARHEECAAARDKWKQMYESTSAQRDQYKADWIDGAKRYGKTMEAIATALEALGVAESGAALPKHAGYNLEGARIDLEVSKGDRVCILTMQRVEAQIGRAIRILMEAL